MWLKFILTSTMISEREAMSRTIRKYRHVHMCAHVSTHAHTGKDLKTQAFREVENGQRNCAIIDKMNHKREKRQAVCKGLKTINYHVKKKGKRKSSPRNGHKTTYWQQQDEDLTSQQAQTLSLTHCST